MSTVTLTLLEAGHCVFPEHITRGRGGLGPVRFPATFALIEHPTAGPLLFDTGYGTAFFSATWSNCGGISLRRWCSSRKPRVTDLAYS